MSDNHISYGELTTSGAKPLQRKLGKYELLSPLGRGGMGEVWLARDTLANVQVAIKMLPPKLRYNDEAQEQIRVSYQCVHKLSHENICAVKDLVEERGTGFFLVMDYFDGITLSKYRSHFVAQHGNFPINEVVRLLTPVAKALDHAHSLGIAHRDIKPTNILVSKDGSAVRVIDFQLAAEIRSTVSRLSQLQVDTSGTYPYLAPEQFLGQRSDSQSDEYSLAMVVYELLAGQLPFETHSYEQWKSIVTEEKTTLPHVPGLPNAIQQLLARGLARQPQQRPTSCIMFLKSFPENSFRDNCSTPKANPPPRSDPNSRAMSFWTSTIASVSGITLCTLLVYVFMQPVPTLYTKHFEDFLRNEPGHLLTADEKSLAERHFGDAVAQFETSYGVEATLKNTAFEDLANPYDLKKISNDHPGISEIASRFESASQDSIRDLRSQELLRATIVSVSVWVIGVLTMIIVQFKVRRGLLI